MQFDTHKVFKQLSEAGLQEKTADAIVNAINESRLIDIENIATKQDLTEVKAVLKQDIHNLELKIADVKLEIADVKSELKQDIADANSELMNAMTKEFQKIYNLGKFILALILIPIGIKLIELFLPKLFQ